MKKTITFCTLLFACLATVSADAATLSFLVDPATIDNNPSDGFITGTEFSPTGSDNTEFIFEPINNQTGPTRFLLSAINGLSFGGGTGSSILFDFTPNLDIQLNSYTIGGGLSLGDPIFDIRDGATVLSGGNSGMTGSNFASAPIQLQGGNTYRFAMTNNSAAIQRQFTSWDYTTTAIPEPGSLAFLSMLGVAGVFRRKRHS